MCDSKGTYQEILNLI